MRKYTYLLNLFVFGLASASAQDLNARVQILSPKIQITNKRAIDELEITMRDFLNNRKWSTDNYKTQERIDCSFILNITSWDGSSNFKAEAQIQSSRPIYGTTYGSTILNLSDKDFNFSYFEGQPLEFSDQIFMNNLSAILAYYAYTIIGLDYDSFSKLGGTPYYIKARNIVDNAQNTPFAGWKAFDNLRNRYWLIENLNNKSYTPVREILYEYHRNGLDLMAENSLKARKQILSLLPDFQKIEKQKQGSMLNQMFFTAKATELINVIEQANPQEKLKAFSILSEIDPANIGKYEMLKN
jgi:Domain of unknown function (DUF4835)